MNRLQKIVPGSKFLNYYCYREARRCISTSNHKINNQKAVEKRTLTESDILAEIQTASFIKKLFVGELSSEVLSYPEYLDDEQLSHILHFKEQCQSLYDESVSSKFIDSNKKISSEVLTKLRDQGLYGLRIPKSYNGLGLSSTEAAQIAEVVGLDFSLGYSSLQHNDIITKAIIDHGSDDQKQRYLPALVKDVYGSVAVYEDNNFMDMTELQTTAEVHDTNSFLINGTKSFVAKLDVSATTLFLVTAEMRPKLKATDSRHSSIGIFLIDSTQEGICFNPIETMGMNGLLFGHLTLKNCIVPKANMLGQPQDGYNNMITILNESRLQYSSYILGLMKNLYTYTLQYTQRKQIFGTYLCQLQFVKDKLAKLASHLYAAESYIYLTTGTVDMKQYPDCHLDASVAKVITSEIAFKVITECASLMDGYTIDKSFPISRCYKDFTMSSVLNGNNDALKSYIAINGLAYAGLTKKETIFKARNKLYYPSFIFSKVLEDKKIWKRKRKKIQNLIDFVHPSHSAVVESLEETLWLFDNTTEFCLADFGSKIVDEGTLLLMLGDVACKFAMISACLSRSSRAYCTGIRHSDLEMNITNIFANEIQDEIQCTLKLIQSGTHAVRSQVHHKITEDLLFNKSYCIENVIKRNI